MYISVYNLWIINLALPLFTEDSLKCLYQARRVSGHVYVLGVSIFASFYDFSIGY